MASTTDSSEPTTSTYQQLIEKARRALTTLETKAGTLTAEGLEVAIQKLVDLHNNFGGEDLEVVPVPTPSPTPEPVVPPTIDPVVPTEPVTPVDAGTVTPANDTGGTLAPDETPKASKKNK